MSFDIAGLEAQAADAEVRLVGSYEFVTAGGKSERQPVSFRASLHQEGGRWRLTAVR